MNLIIGLSPYGMVFEGEFERGAHLVWPQPVMTLAKFAKSTDEALIPATNDKHQHCYFREDSFDPVSRIRRGRFYQATGKMDSWYVIPPPFRISTAGPESDGLLCVPGIKAYDAYKFSVNTVANFQDLVVLGSSNAFAVWSIVGIETISTGEDLVTLKARQSFGVLPDINWRKVPADNINNVQEAIEKLADDYRRAGPESVIDRAREAATAILSAYLQSQGADDAKGKDLGDLVKKLASKSGQNEQRIVACAAEIPQRLHSRGKHAEKEKHDGLRPIREQDAELAVQCIGAMLCDLHWADWK